MTEINEMKEIKETGWRLDNSYARLPELFFTRLLPSRVRSPELIIINGSLAASLGLDVHGLEGSYGAEVFSGNLLPAGALPLSQAYAGHQFGYFTMLGDGRAHLLGEQITPIGERVDIQLKGSGRTPYSRGGDGRAALGPMLREYIISEAMHALGIPTTRSLAVVKTGEPVYRETKLPGAILTRVAASHIRVVTFQYAAGFGSVEELKALADYTINRHFPELKDNHNPYISLIAEVVKGQAALIARWQLVGFIHGVMNTDNMSVSGETIDYGPCAFMDAYDPSTVFSSIDTYGRYAYENQPKIAVWNLARFAETLVPLLDANQERAVEIARDRLSLFDQFYKTHWLAGMRSKLGIFNTEEDDEALIKDLLNIMKENNADYTNTFRSLTLDAITNSEGMFATPEFSQWHERWQARLGRQQEAQAAIKELMRNTNPAIIPRNHRVEEALAAATQKEDYTVMERLLKALAKPYAYSDEQIDYSQPPVPSSCRYKTFCGT